MAALREAWEDGYDAIIAIDAGQPDRARVYLKNATGPAVRAFPDDGDVSFCLVRVFGALLEAAA